MGVLCVAGIHINGTITMENTFRYVKLIKLLAKNIKIVYLRLLLMEIRVEFSHFHHRDGLLNHFPI